MRSLVDTLVAVAGALLATGLLLAVIGRNPVPILSTIFAGSLGSWYGLSETLVKAAPIIFCALAVSVPAWAGLMNVGAEGQFLMGALGATGVALAIGEQPAWIVIPAMLSMAFVVGGLWAGAAGALRAKLGVNEVMFTLMCNFVALLFVQHMVYGPWKDPGSHGWPQTVTFTANSMLPRFGTTRIHAGLLLGIIAATVLYIFYTKTRWGLALRLIQANAKTAEYAGIRVQTYWIWGMVVGGGLAALAGAIEVSAIEGRLRPTLAVGYGYTGILVAWLSNHNPLAVLIVSFFLASIMAGGDSVQVLLQLPYATVNIIIGLIFMFFLLAPHLVLKLQRGSK